VDVIVRANTLQSIIKQIPTAHTRQENEIADAQEDEVEGLSSPAISSSHRASSNRKRAGGTTSRRGKDTAKKRR
jgi:hypothetical protein